MDNPFKKIFGGFGKTGESVLGIDVGSSALKVVQLRKKAGRAVLETYGELSLGPYANLEIGRATQLPPEKLSEALLDLLRESHATTKKCGIALPLPSSLVTIVPMPAVDEARLAQMIPLEARKYIPVPVSEVVLDWSVIPRDPSVVGSPIPPENRGPKMMPRADVRPPGAAPTMDAALQPVVRNEVVSTDKTFGSIDVLVVAIHNDVINKYQNLAGSVGLDASFFEIEVFSTMRSILDQDGAVSMVFDMGASATKLYIMDRGIIRFSHIINRGSQDITLAIARSMNLPTAHAEKLKREQGIRLNVSGKDLSSVVVSTLDYIFSEASRVLSNFQKKYNRTVNQIVLSGGGVNLIGFEELAKKQFNIPVRLGSPFSKVETPAFLDKVLAQAGPEFAVAIGVALRKLQEME